MAYGTGVHPPTNPHEFCTCFEVQTLSLEYSMYMFLKASAEGLLQAFESGWSMHRACEPFAF